MKRLTFALILVAGPAFAADAPKPAETSKPVLTAVEGKKLYEYGFKMGVAQAAMEAARQDAKPVLEKLQPPSAGNP